MKFPLRLVALISGRGSNLQALLDQAAGGELGATFAAVFSNRPDAAGLERARRYGVRTVALDHTRFPDRPDFDAELRRQIDAFEPELILLAGFMRVLGADFAAHYHGRLLNIHPSLLPKYQGLDTHARVLAAGDRAHGASVHFVTAKLDGGPVIAQVSVPVHRDDDAEILAARVLRQEHRLYSRVVRWFADGRIELKQDRVFFDSKPLPAAIQFTDTDQW